MPVFLHVVTALLLVVAGLQVILMEAANEGTW